MQERQQALGSLLIGLLFVVFTFTGEPLVVFGFNWEPLIAVGFILVGIKGLQEQR